MTGDTRPAPDQAQQKRDASNMPPMLQDWVKGVSTGSGGAPSPEVDFRTTSAPSTTTKTEEKRPDGTVKTITASTQPVFKTTGSLYQRLQNPITSGSQQAQQNLQQASDVFKQMAGPSRTYGGIGGEQTVRQAIETGQGMEDARALANAQYGGPMGLDPTELSRLQGVYEDISTRTGALGTGGGLASMIKGSAPGLTQGEALFEAKRRLPEMEEVSRNLMYEQVNPLRQQLQQQSTAAQEFAEQRALEEDLIRESARGQLTGRKDVIDENLAQVVANARAQQEAAQAAYANILGAESPERLAAIQAASPYLRGGTTEDPGQLMGTDVAEAFRTPGRTIPAEAQAEMQRILNDPRYAAIKDVDPLELGITKRGKSFYDVGDEDVRRAVPDKAKRALLYERQKELENQFDVGGQYGAFSPLYHGEAFQAPDVTRYLGFDPGTSPTRENLATGQQKEIYNRITDLLGSLDKMGESQPFRAAQIFAQADKYIADEEAALEAQGENLTKNQLAWKGQVKKARKAYKKAKRGKEYGQIGAAIGGVVLGDPYLGARIGEGLA